MQLNIKFRIAVKLQTETSVLFICIGSYFIYLYAQWPQLKPPPLVFATNVPNRNLRRLGTSIMNISLFPKSTAPH